MYNEKFRDHAYNPRDFGEIQNADILKDSEPSIDGDIVRIFLKIEPNNIISDIKFQTFGCINAIACTSMVTELVKGKSLKEVKKISFDDILPALEGIPEYNLYCCDLGIKTLLAAIKDYEKSV